DGTDTLSATGQDAADESATGKTEPVGAEAEPAAAAPVANPAVAPASTTQPVAEPKPEASSQSPKPQAAATPQPSEPDSFIKDLMGNTMLLAVLGGSALLLLLIALMALSRRNAMKEAELQESLLAESLP